MFGVLDLIERTKKHVQNVTAHIGILQEDDIWVLKKRQSPNTNSKKKRNWEQEILPFVKKELERFNKEGIKPTLRTIFYRLASYDNILRNVKGDYIGLSKL